MMHPSENSVARPGPLLLLSPCSWAIRLLPQSVKGLASNSDRRPRPYSRGAPA